MADPQCTPPPRKWGIVDYLRTAAFVLGIGFAVWLIRSAGSGEVLAVLGEGWPWLSVVALLEALFAGMDIFCLRALLGPAARGMSLRTWVRASTLAYGVNILLPAGRAAGEVMRATIVAREAGAARAANAGARLQACSLLGNAIASLGAGLLIALSWRAGRVLALALVANALACGSAGFVLLSLLRSTTLGLWIRKILTRFKRPKGPELLGTAEGASALSADPSTPGATATLQATVFCTVARLIQVVQYGALVQAVGGRVTARMAFVAEGIHLVGATVGDFVPNQMGITEGAYRAFASDLGLGAEPARALSIALLVRIAQLLLAVGCLGGAMLIRERSPAAEARRAEPRPATS